MQVVDAAGAVLGGEDFTQAHSLARAEPDGGLVLVGYDLEQLEYVVGGGYPLGGAGQAAQDRREMRMALQGLSGMTLSMTAAFMMTLRTSK